MKENRVKPERGTAYLTATFRPPVFDREQYRETEREVPSGAEFVDMDSCVGSDGRRRSRRREIAELREVLLNDGATVAQIAKVVAKRYKVSMLMAFRLAYGLSQSEVAELYNRGWPSENPRTDKCVGYWERWKGPGSPACASARKPSLLVLRRLAELYGCLVDDLIRPVGLIGG